MAKPTVYIASKTKHAPKWIELKSKGYNIISTWILEYQSGSSRNVEDLAIRCIKESSEADYTILYCETGDFLRFALAEVGAALSANKKVIVVGKSSSLSQVMLRHPNIYKVQTLNDALNFLVRPAF